MRYLFLFAALGLFALSGSVHAQTTPTLGEKSVGNSCANGSSAINFDTIAQCNTTSGAGTFQKAPVFVGAATSPPYAAVTCDATKAGMLQYTASGLQGCDGSNWVVFATTPIVVAQPSAFSFTDQPSASTGFVNSNAVTLSGGFSGLTAVCGTGCTAIAKNGVWGGTTVTGFNSGDTIAIQLKNMGCVVYTATVTVGTTTSSVWSVGVQGHCAS